MAFFDQTLLLSSAQALTSTTTTSTNIYDVTGAGSGVAPAMTFGNAAKAQFDIGNGDGMAIPYLMMVVNTAAVSGGGATLCVEIQGATDVSNSPSAYTTIVRTKDFTVAELAAGATLLIPIPKVTIGEALPRFYRITYTIATSTFSALAVTSVILLNPPSGIQGTLYPSNFVSV